MKSDIITLTLPCNFTQQEIDERRDQFNALFCECDNVEQEKAEVVKTYNAQLKALHAKMRALSHAIVRKGEDRAVECVVFPHTPTTGLKMTVRKDTQEVVSTETMTDAERQENLFDDGPGCDTPAPDLLSKAAV